MPTYAFYADEERKRRSDGCNTVIANGTDVLAARLAAETLVGEAGAFVEFAAVDLADAPAFTVQGHPPTGAIQQSIWPPLGRGGDPLRGA